MPVGRRVHGELHGLADADSAPRTPDETEAVGDADPEWLAAPGRRYPLTIDPTFTQPSTNPGAFDTWVYSAEYADTSFASQAWLVVGSTDGGLHTTRSFLRFDTSSLPTGADVTVLDSKLSLYQWYAGSCAPTDIDVHGLAAAPSGSYGYPDWTRGLSVDLHLGAEPAAATDRIGPVAVNLASGNVMVGHDSPAYPALGGPIGLSLAYN